MGEQVNEEKFRMLLSGYCFAKPLFVYWIRYYVSDKKLIFQLSIVVKDKINIETFVLCTISLNCSRTIIERFLRPDRLSTYKKYEIGFIQI